MGPAEAPRDPAQPETEGKGKRPGAYSGRLLLRMPESLHADLARASERAGVSLNAFINDALAGVVRRGPARTPASQARAGDAPRSRPLLERLLVVNAVMVAVVGVVALVLLVQALR